MLSLYVLVLSFIYSNCEKGGRVGSHGQMMFLSDTFETDRSNSIIVYTKHLGGHSPPHDYQDVMIGRFDFEGPFKFNKDQVYHFLPKDDSLDDWLSGDLTVFTGNLHNGTFYEAKPILKGTLTRLRGIWSNLLIDDKETLPTQKYAVFNKVKNVYNLEHYLEGEKDAFQYSVRAEIEGNILNDGEILEFYELRNIKDDVLVKDKEYNARILGRNGEQKVTVKNVSYYINPDKKDRMNFLEKTCHDLE